MKMSFVGACCAVVVVAANLCSSSQAASSQRWFLQTAALSHHFEPTRAAGREWNETHAGLGLERRDDADGAWQLRWAGGALRDSRSYWGGYAGAAYMRQWRASDALETSLGLSAFAFYRAVNWSGKRQVIPALLPTASIGAADGSFGLNIIYVPRFGKSNGTTTPPTIVGQLVFGFR